VIEEDSTILEASSNRKKKLIFIRLSSSWCSPGIAVPLNGVVQHGEVRSRDVAVVFNIAEELRASENAEERDHEALLGDGVIWSTERDDKADPIKSSFTFSVVYIGCQLCGRRTVHRVQPSRVDGGVRGVDIILDLFQDAGSHIGSEREAGCCSER